MWTLVGLSFAALLTTFTAGEEGMQSDLCFDYSFIKDYPNPNTGSSFQLCGSDIMWVQIGEYGNTAMRVLSWCYCSNGDMRHLPLE